MVLIYDKSCPACRTFAKLVSPLAKAKGVKLLDISDEKVQKFLGEIFDGDAPWALYFVEKGKIWWGDEAVRRFLKVFSVPFIPEIGYMIYPFLKMLNPRAREECPCRANGVKIDPKIDPQKILS